MPRKGGGTNEDIGPAAGRAAAWNRTSKTIKTGKEGQRLNEDEESGEKDHVRSALYGHDAVSNGSPDVCMGVGFRK